MNLPEELIRNPEILQLFKTYGYEKTPEEKFVNRYKMTYRTLHRLRKELKNYSGKQTFKTLVIHDQKLGEQCVVKNINRIFVSKIIFFLKLIKSVCVVLQVKISQSNQSHIFFYQICLALKRAVLREKIIQFPWRTSQ